MPACRPLRNVVPAAVAAVLLAACATPAPVRSALDSLDEELARNLRLMQQYHALVVQINDRYRLWDGYARRRILLDIALQWVTDDPFAADDDLLPLLVDEHSRTLGPELVGLINGIRLAGLPARRGESGEVFAAGQHRFDSLVQALPGLVSSIDRQVERQLASGFRFDYSGFDAYRANGAALARINQALRDYLAIDVTIRPEDLAAASRAWERAR